MQMRKIFVIAFSALLGALSCEVLPEPLKLSEDGIRFYVKDVATKTTEVTASTLASSGFNVSATSGTAGSEAEVFTNTAFSLSSGVYSGGQFWPVDEPAGGYHFYASNSTLAYHAGGATVSALNSTDVVCAYLPDPDFGEENELTFIHVFARLDTVKVVAESGYTISNVSIRVTPKTGGTYDLRAGAGHADGTGWSSPVTGSETAVATSVGANVPDLYMVPGRYEVKASWHAVLGSYEADITDETVYLDFVAGKRSEVTFTLGGYPEEIKFHVSVAPWAIVSNPDGNRNISQPLSFQAKTDGTVVWKCTDASIARTIYYKKNGGDWTEITSTTAGASISVVEGDVVEFYGTNDSYADLSTNAYYNSFADGTAEVYIYGNILSLIDFSLTIPVQYCFSELFSDANSGDSSIFFSHPSKRLYLPATALTSCCYSGMFFNCANLTSAPALPATILAVSSYESMFDGCSSLTVSPELPATALAANCYSNMFVGCSSLAAAPALPATMLTQSCYYCMFQDCTSLSTAPALPATDLAVSCYQNMFQGCSSLVSAPELPAIILKQNCYNSMFKGCTSLVAAPELAATTLAVSCYESMFNGCTGLVSVPSVLPADVLATSCYSNMFLGCTSLAFAPELPAMTLANTCYYGMFENCTSLTSAPSLPATSLFPSCYMNMFCGCTSLATVPAILPAVVLAYSCYRKMFYGCSNLTVAPELPAATLTSNGYNQMFMNCSRLSYIKCLATDVTAGYSIYQWVRGVSATGTFVKHPDIDWGSSTPSGWTVEDAVI